jgi:membrane protease YdiL (CAAX protease family)
MSRDAGRANVAGWQIIVLIFVALLAGVLADKYGLLPPFAWTTDGGRFVTFAVMGAFAFGIPELRRTSLALLSAPLAPSRLGEVTAVAALQLAASIGALGAMALWSWSIGGEPALARHLSSVSTSTDALARSFSSDHITRTFLLGAILAPFLEELFYRGLLYRAWEARWGTRIAAVLTSIAFAVSHAWGIPQFFASLLLIALYRRTGSLWACMLCHAAINVLLWHPLGGQFAAPAPGVVTGELANWTPQLICLAVAFFGIPIYLWMSRDEAISVKDDGAPIPLPARD